MTPDRQWTIIDGKFPEALITYIRNLKGNYRLVLEKKERKRTSKQNAALHLWFHQMAQTLNQDGHDMRAVIRPEIDIMWTDYAVKEYLWRPVQKALYGKKSTTQLKSNEIDEIFDVVSKAVGERVGVFIPFPSEENLNEQI